MAAKVNIERGPADGLQTSAGDRFVWLEVVAVKRADQVGAAELYELIDGRYEHVGGRRSRCGCGAVFTRAEGGAERQPCPLCGAGASTEGATR